MLEHRHLSRVARVVNRTVAGGVAARVRVPVVAVPSGWTRSGGAPVVVAGVDVPERSAEVLSAAVAESRARGATLTVVHSWAMPVHYEGVLIEPAEHARWTDRSKAEVRAALDALGDESVAIDAEVVVHPGRAVEAILDAAEGADLLVIGRHDPLVPHGSHIGPVARAVLREATCPVLLASPEASHLQAQVGRHQRSARLLSSASPQGQCEGSDPVRRSWRSALAGVEADDLDGLALAVVLGGDGVERGHGRGVPDVGVATGR